jgi:hypothetical protein
MSHTCGRGCGECVLDPHYQGGRTPPFGQDDQGGAVQGPEYLACSIQLVLWSMYEALQRSYLFVAINTLMFPRGSNPSNWLINSSMVRWTSLSPPAPSSNRAPPIASTSSKKMIHAFLLRAISKSSRTMRAPSPTYFWTSSDPMTRMNVASVRLATARAHSVLPVPGGPKSKMPLGGSIPSLTNRSG